MDYIRRRLSVHVEGAAHVLSEDEFLDMGNVLVLLAEPGAGKTALAEAVAKRHHAVSVSATNFVQQGIRQAPLHDGTLIIIDGLDEVASRRWGDGVDRVISGLAHLGNRKVLISCRAAEWEGARNRALLRELYGPDPIEGGLEPFSEAEQLAFLRLVAP